MCALKFKSSFFLLLVLVFSATELFASDHADWNWSRRYMAKGICDSNYDDMCKGSGFCDTGGAVTNCTQCGEHPGGWYQYSYYCAAPAANVCTGNAVTKNYAYPEQSCDEYCLGWGVHYCFILDGAFKPCSLGNQQDYCQCGEIIGTTPGCTPTPPDSGE